MGSRDKKQRETRKPKKDIRKTALSSILAPPPPVVEVIKVKGKKEPREED
ncbi:MAG: hypothetical protein HYX80_06360 [Chloroflexi bacterium]|nr:hypothetical protein [Chloroflexota bacterium]